MEKSGAKNSKTAVMGKLFVVGTPIGNLLDITMRAIQTLSDVDVILAEDTRVTKKLLNHYEIHTPLKRFDAKIEAKKSHTFLDMLKNGKHLALVSDAGTPAISDPGANLVREVRNLGIEVVAIPGPSALTAALSVAGVPADPFVFLGFPPHKKGRKTFFEKMAKQEETVVFYESPHRIMKALASLKKNVGERKIVIARELTKVHEEILEGTAQELALTLEEKPKKQKGEFVVIMPSTS